MASWYPKGCLFGFSTITLISLGSFVVYFIWTTTGFPDREQTNGDIPLGNIGMNTILLNTTMFPSA